MSPHQIDLEMSGSVVVLGARRLGSVAGGGAVSISDMISMILGLLLLFAAVYAYQHGLEALIYRIADLVRAFRFAFGA